MNVIRWTASSTVSCGRQAFLTHTRSIHGPFRMSERLGRLPHGFKPRSRHTRRMTSSIGRVFAASNLQEMIQQKNAEHALVVYSRSWCPFCSEVRNLFSSLKAQSKFIELDEIVEGDDIQDVLTEMTGSRTVPQVFVGGSYVGGCDDTFALHGQGKLKPLLEQADVEFLSE